MTWHGEGEAKIYLDGDNEYPTLSGTGMEDYVGSAWGYGVYSHPYQGCIVADREKGHYCIYRYTFSDPVYFYQDCRATIQQIGGTGPGTEDAKKFIAAGTKLTGTLKDEYDMTGNGEISSAATTTSSCAYFYLDRPRATCPIARRWSEAEGIGGIISFGEIDRPKCLMDQSDPLRSINQIIQITRMQARAGETSLAGPQEFDQAFRLGIARVQLL